jgi:hypothetical protein
MTVNNELERICLTALWHDIHVATVTSLHFPRQAADSHNLLSVHSVTWGVTLQLLLPERTLKPLPSGTTCFADYP